MSDSAPDPFEMLFRARWNVPQAAAALGLTPCVESWDEVKTMFRAYCAEHPVTHGFTGDE